MNVKLLFLTAIVALILSFLSPAMTDVKEGWGSLQFGLNVVPEVVKPNGQVKAFQGNLVGAQMKHDFVSVPSFQSMLSPRMGIAQGMGPNLRYNPGPQSMSAIPPSPLGYGEMFEESYVPSGCNQSAQPSANWNNQNVAQSVAMVEASVAGSSDAGVSALPIGTMDMMNSEGQVGQEVMMQRYMYALPKDRLFGRADWIRGDLAIVPDTPKCGEGWFNVYPTINTTLNPGAMNVMGGFGSESSMAMANLLNVASGGAKTAVAGVDLANIDMTPQYKTQFMDAKRSIQVSAFP